MIGVGAGVPGGVGSASATHADRHSKAKIVFTVISWLALKAWKRPAIRVFPAPAFPLLILPERVCQIWRASWFSTFPRLGTQLCPQVWLRALSLARARRPGWRRAAA